MVVTAPVQVEGPNIELSIDSATELPLIVPEQAVKHVLRETGLVHLVVMSVYEDDGAARGDAMITNDVIELDQCAVSPFVVKSLRTL